MRGGTRMKNHRKIIIFSIAITAFICLCLSRRVTLSKPAQNVTVKAASLYTDELKNINKNDRIIIYDDKPCQTGWIPEKEDVTLSKIVLWLNKAKLYNGKIPESKNAIFHAYVGPSILNIYTTNKHKIIIKPAYYIDRDKRNTYSMHYVNGILEFDFDKQKLYIQSSILYDWLKNDRWKAEFKKN